MTRSKELFNKAKGKWKEAKEETDYKESLRREKKAENKKSRQMWFGEKPTFAEKMTYSNHKLAFVYAENNLLEYGNPLYTIDCKYQNEKLSGILIAFENHLLFVSLGGKTTLARAFDYTQIKNFDPYSNNKIELSFQYNNTNHLFKGLIKGEQSDKMINILKKKVTPKLNTKPQHQSQPKNNSDTTVNYENKDNKLDQLERLGKLRDNGVLSEEEFQNEKEKILDK